MIKWHTMLLLCDSNQLFIHVGCMEHVQLGWLERVQLVEVFMARVALTPEMEPV